MQQVRQRFPGDVVMAFREYGALLRVWTRAGKVLRVGDNTSRPLCLSVIAFRACLPFGFHSGLYLMCVSAGRKE